MRQLLILGLVPVAICFQNVRLPASENELTPVHGLYIKRSADGTSGDLYVAASEDNGITTPWVSEKAVNILPGESKEVVQRTGQFDTSAFMKSNFMWSPESDERKPQGGVVILDPSKSDKEDGSSVGPPMMPFPGFGYPMPPIFFMAPFPLFMPPPAPLMLEKDLKPGKSQSS